MRYAIAVALLCLLPSCNAALSPAQTAFALEAGFDAAVDIAVAYASLPRCGQTVSALCSDPAIVGQANTAAHGAYTAIHAAQAAVHGDPAAAAQAIAAAQAALAALRTITDHMKVH